MEPLLLILLQILLVISLSSSSKQLALAQDFIYNGFDGANLTLDGAAKILSNGLLELTNTSKQEIARAFYALPVHFNTSSPSNNTVGSYSFSTSFLFAMVPETSTRGGHGIAFVISPSRDFKGATSTQYLGLFNLTSIGLSSNRVLAIELDTVKSPEFLDINDNHVGVDLNNLTSIESAPAAFFLENEGRNESLKLTSGRRMQVWIDYSDAEKLLNVTLAPFRSMKPERPLLSTSIDLALFLLESMYVGFSSSTGSLASHHYILAWSFNRSGQAQSLDSSNLPSLPSKRSSREKVQLTILLSAIAVIVFLVISSAVVYVMKKRYEEIREDWEQQYGPQRFTYKDLHKATKGFKDKELLGSGGFGRVYRGVLPSSNAQVAVKKVSHDSKQGMIEFVAEIVSLGRLRHRNLVQLLGYCRRKGELFLVYDYMPNGSLDKFLFGSERPKLNWAQRYQIIKGVASALLYLHEQWEQVVLHRDVKASNVLLNADLNGRLGDFGLAKFHDHGSSPQTSRLVGTVGYLAPELSSTGRATTSSDVFAFGTFLLEVACGRKPVDPRRPTEQVVLVDWVLECWRREAVLETSDPRLEDNYVVQEMELVLKLGLLCAQRTPAARPSMRQVVQFLDVNASMPEMPMNGAGIGLLSGSPLVSRDGCTFPTSGENMTSYSLSGTDSILSCGR